MRARIAACVLLVLFALLPVTQAQATEDDSITSLIGGYQSPSTPTPEPTAVVLEPTATPEPEITPEPQPVQETIPTPTSIIMRAIRPLSLMTVTETMTEEEKLEKLESNMDSITVSLTFLQKARGYDIKFVLELIAQIRGKIGELTLKQLDALVTVTSDIDNEVVMSIFGGAITQQDIDRMAAQLEEAINRLDEPEPTPGTGEIVLGYDLGVVLGVITGVLSALIWAVTLKI